MTLPDGFQLSQSSLQDYVECQRRFQLRYLLHLAWPAVEAEPYLENERRMDLGAQFHTIVRQFLIGLPEHEISRMASGNETMQTWWSNFLRAAKDADLRTILEPGNQRFEEITLSVPILRFRLVAKCDLLIIHNDGKITIFDWKTSENPPRRSWLAERLQTHVYPYVVTGSLTNFTGNLPNDPNLVEMVYWFTNFPDQAERFSYDTRKYQDDARLLTDLVSTIDKKDEAVFQLTPDIKRCLFCTYRSLCNRGVKPGDLKQLEDIQETASAEDVIIDFDQIGEIEF